MEYMVYGEGVHGVGTRVFLYLNLCILACTDE